MRRVKCEDCGKLYDYDYDAFCPRCGAFNQPGKQKSEFGPTVKLEEGGRDSFFREKFSGEKSKILPEKPGRGMEKQITRLRQSMARSAAQAEHQTRQEAEVPPAQSRRNDKAGMPAVLPWIVGLLVLIKLLGTILSNH